MARSPSLRETTGWHIPLESHSGPAPTHRAPGALRGGARSGPPGVKVPRAGRPRRRSGGHAASISEGTVNEIIEGLATDTTQVIMLQEVRGRPERGQW